VYRAATPEMSRGWNDDDRTTEMIDSYRGDVFFHLIFT
jgi:hypothetical protein